MQFNTDVKIGFSHLSCTSSIHVHPILRNMIELILRPIRKSKPMLLVPQKMCNMFS